MRQSRSKARRLRITSKTTALFFLVGLTCYISRGSSYSGGCAAFSIGGGSTSCSRSPLAVAPVSGSRISNRRGSTATQLSARSAAVAPITSPLFGKRKNDHHGRKYSRLLLLRNSFEAAHQQWNQTLTKQQRRRNWSRRVATVAAAVFIWWGASFGHPSALAPPAAHAAVSSTPVFTERILEKTSPSVDALVDRYVRQHMFDDDTTQQRDPVAATYREAYDDATTGRHPAALREITADVLQGKDVGISSSSFTPSEQEGGFQNIGSMLTAAVKMLQKRVGLSESTAAMVLAGLFVVVGPSLCLLFAMIVGGISKRNMTALFKKRYGEDYTVDATVKKEESVEAPDDEEDEDEDEDEDDDDDEDDEE